MFISRRCRCRKHLDPSVVTCQSGTPQQIWTVMFIRVITANWDVSFLQNMFTMPSWQSACRSLPYDSHSLRAYWFNQRTNQLSSQYSAHQCHFTSFFLGIARITGWLHDDSFCLMLSLFLSRITRTHCTCSRYLLLRLSSLKSLNRSKRVTWQYIQNIHYTLDI